MIKFIDVEDAGESMRQLQRQLGTEVAQVAGIRPLPRARMARQAGRRKNEMFGSYGGGPMLFSRSRDATKRVKFSAEEVQTMLRSDPQFAASYQRQVVDGKRDEQTDKYDIRQWPDGSVTGYQYEPWTESDGSVRRQSIGKDAVKELTLERHRKNTQVVNEWDPIEASAQEDYNRLRGGNKNPLPDPGSVLIDLESIPTPSNPDGVRLFPGV